jgi:hypothetical protein
LFFVLLYSFEFGVWRGYCAAVMTVDFGLVLGLPQIWGPCTVVFVPYMYDTGGLIYMLIQKKYCLMPCTKIFQVLWYRGG